MAKLIQTANAGNNKEGMNDFSAIPAGKYVVMISKSTFKQTKAKTGHYLQLSLKVTEGQHKGKILFENLNLDNPNPVAVEIANKALNSICQACGKSGVDDSEELHGIPFIATVAVTPATPQRGEGNQIKFYEPCSDDDSTTGGDDETPANTGDGKLPWESDE